MCVCVCVCVCVCICASVCVGGGAVECVSSSSDICFSPSPCFILCLAFAISLNIKEILHLQNYDNIQCVLYHGTDSILGCISLIRLDCFHVLMMI